MDFLATFLEGIVTFASPCLLPLLPLYLAYFAGDAGAPLAGGVTPGARTRRMLVHVLGFALGFSCVFAALGAFSGLLGSALVRYGSALNVACGAVVVAFGLSYAGVLRIPLLERTFKFQAGRVPGSFAGCVLFGIVFALGWTPCVGVFLGSALALAAVESSAARGTLLLLCYSAGLALPFALSALALDRLSGAFAAVKAHYATVNRACGWLLVAMGVLMATGILQSLLRAAAQVV